MPEWLNPPESLDRLTVVGSSLTQGPMRQATFSGLRVVMWFSRGCPFSPCVMVGSAQNERNNLDDLSNIKSIKEIKRNAITGQKCRLFLHLRGLPLIIKQEEF